MSANRASNSFGVRPSCRRFHIVSADTSRCARIAANAKPRNPEVPAHFTQPRRISIELILAILNLASKCSGRGLSRALLTSASKPARECDTGPISRSGSVADYPTNWELPSTYAKCCPCNPDKSVELPNQVQLLRSPLVSNENGILKRKCK